MEKKKDELTIRDQFAIAALPRLMRAYGSDNPYQRCKTAYLFADAMMEARKVLPKGKEPEPPMFEKQIEALKKKKKENLLNGDLDRHVKMVELFRKRLK